MSCSNILRYKDLSCEIYVIFLARKHSYFYKDKYIHQYIMENKCEILSFIESISIIL